MTRPRFEQLPALFIGVHDDPLKMEIMNFSPSDLEHFWPLNPNIARTLPQADLRDPLATSELIAPGAYSSPQTMVDTLSAAGFAQGGLFVTTTERRKVLTGHVAVRQSPAAPAAELKVHIFEPQARKLAEVALSTIVRLAAYAQENLNLESVEADVLDTDQILTSAYAKVGFTHIPNARDYDAIACGTYGEEYSHFQTWELRHPDAISASTPDNIQQSQHDGWQQYQIVRKFVRW